MIYERYGVKTMETIVWSPFVKDEAVPVYNFLALRVSQTVEEL